MGEFTTIALAKAQKKGNIKFKVISLGELKNGLTIKKKPYQKQDAVIKDSSGAMNLTLWNEHIGLLEAGFYYSLENAWWSDYKGDAQLSLGNYHQLEKISESDFVNSSADASQPTLEQSSNPATVSTTTPGTPPPRLVGMEDKIDAILHEFDTMKPMIEALFKKMVDQQLEDAKK